MKTISTAFRLFLVLTILTGVAYPLLITAIGQGLFSEAANGSAIKRNGRVMGSRLIGQAFTDPKYFWGRPSAAGERPYNAAISSGSNLGPTNPALVGGKDKDGNDVPGAIEERVAALRSASPANQGPIPTDLVTASASGLDPHISIAAAEYQMARVARARGLKIEEIKAEVLRHTSGRQLGALGEPVVNVLELNLALDGE